MDQGVASPPWPIGSEPTGTGAEVHADGKIGRVFSERAVE
jgi:hypothetical protein